MRIPNVVHMLYGSNLYGLANENSDKDYAGIYMPTMEEILLQNAKQASSNSTGDDHSKNGADDTDAIMFSLPQFLDMCLKGDTTAIDMLHSHTPLSENWIFAELRAERKRFYCKNMKAYVGYVKSQAMKYGLKGDKVAELKVSMEYCHKILEEESDLPFGPQLKDYLTELPTGKYVKCILTRTPNGDRFYEVLGKKYQDTVSIQYLADRLTKMYESYGHRAKQAADNDGMDWKALSHALRVAYQVRSILENGDFFYPLAETDFILRVKAGKASYGEEVAPELDKILDEITLLTESSGLPDSPDVEYWNKWLMGVYQQWFNIEWKEA